jgi:hypothetical protein
VTVPRLALEPVLIDAGTGPSIRTLDEQLLDRAGRDDYEQWLAASAAARGCIRPVRLNGTMRDVDSATGQILRSLDTSTLPDKVIYTPCGDRRASVCPACADTYRRDTYELIRAGLAVAKACLTQSAVTLLCSPPSRRLPSGPSTPAAFGPTAGPPGAGPAAKFTSARTVVGCPAANSTGRPIRS